MSTSKVEAVVENWFPRFLANGLDYLDVRRMLDQVDAGTTGPGLEQGADDYADLGRAALADGPPGHRGRAPAPGRTHPAVRPVRPDRQPARRAPCSAARPSCTPAAPRCSTPRPTLAIGRGTRRRVGYLRVPPAGGTPAPGRGRPAARPGVHQGAVQHLRAVLPAPGRGHAVGGGPGTGRGLVRRAVPVCDLRRGDGRRRRRPRRLGRLDGPRRAGSPSLGTSFGGYLALRLPPTVRRLAGVVDIAGPYDLARLRRTPAGHAGRPRPTSPAPRPRRGRALLADVTLDGVLEATARTDPGRARRSGTAIIPSSHAPPHRGATLGDRAEARPSPTGNHSCNNLATVVRPCVADWVADRLREAS